MLCMAVALSLLLLRVVHDELAIAGEALGTHVDVLGAGIVVEGDLGSTYRVGRYRGVPVERAAKVGTIRQFVTRVVAMVV